MHRLVPALVLLSACGSGSDTNFRNLTAEIAVAPEIIDFGDVVVLEPSVQQVFISNAGRRDLEVTLTLDGGKGAFQITETEQVIPASEDAWSVAIQFIPESFFTYDASLIIESNDETDPVFTVPISGVGVDAPRPDIDVQPVVLDWGADTDDDFSPFQFLEILNTGTADLHIGAADQEGSGAFELTTDPSYATVAPGTSTPVILTYTPVQSDGDSGTILLNSDDADEPVVQITLLGNGGGNFNYPVPIIDCPGTSAPPEFLTLDGSQSYDPDGNEPLSYIWLLALKPQGSQSYVTNLITDSTDLWTDIAGDFEVMLQVQNSIGVTSAPDRCLINAIPRDDLHVELTWDTSNVDLDLHLIEDGFELFETPYDCNFCNKNPQWGTNGATDDPRLDLDDRSDGPENTNIETPEDGVYHTKVHYFDPVGGPATTATVTVWAYGVEVSRTQKILEWDEVWDVGQVNWPAGTFGVDSGDAYKAPTRACY